VIQNPTVPTPNRDGMAVVSPEESSQMRHQDDKILKSAA
jgi:hypothetical protein